jgi:hypothetical protein
MWIVWIADWHALGFGSRILAWATTYIPLTVKMAGFFQSFQTFYLHAHI